MGDILDIEEIDQTKAAVVGGKGAALGELSRIGGVSVPPGFCVTAEAFRRVVSRAPPIDDRLDRLSQAAADDGEAIGALSAEIRQAVEGVAIPDDLASAVARRLARLGEPAAFAVRSSATAEDLPGASFAGQYDTFLNVTGVAETLQAVRRCWASLFTERAVSYRLRGDLDQRDVAMAVVVQQMVFPRASGVLFTADPVTANRKTATVEATLGLGEALVSGLVNADVFKVGDGEIVSRAVGAKRLGVYASAGGGTAAREVDYDYRRQPALTDAEVLRLVQLGRRIEAHFGRPQDIEWCAVADGFRIVQSRPITTLFPIPPTPAGEDHVYVSVGHQQMMTDAMKPLGLSVWQHTAFVPMHVAGGRLFVDVTERLASPSTRAGLLEMIGRGDPLTGDALHTVLERGFIRTLPGDTPAVAPAPDPPAPIDPDPAIVTQLIERSETSIAALKHAIAGKSGAELLDFIVEDFAELKRIIFDPLSREAIMAGMEAAWWLGDQLEAWLGETHAADTLTQSVPHNVTSEMGLALLDVADAIRAHPDVVTFLQGVEDDGFLDRLPGLAGGAEASAAIRSYLGKYGVRCVGEIDITRPRWSERPTALVPLILSNVANFAPGAAERHFEQGRREAWAKEQELLGRLRALPDGDEKAKATKRVIDRVRAFTGYREYPKYSMVSRYFVYKQALLSEARRLIEAGVLRDAEDVFYLTLEELGDVARTGQVDDQLIRQRIDEFRCYQSLTPPRVLTSDGEVIEGSYHRNGIPDGALVGLPVSSGTVEGRARVIVDMAQADLDPGDVLVTAYTDPSWSPLFLAVRALVTEVGGLMTHGAVIAREYGLPAVVGVERATQLIADGQQIRVHGTEGYVELLD